MFWCIRKKPHRAGVDDALRAPLKLYAKGNNKKCRMIRKRITYIYEKELKHGKYYATKSEILGVGSGL